MTDQAQGLRNSIDEYKKKKLTNIENQTRVIVVTSGKGGVGKTNFSVNLGIALAELGLKTMIFDADLGLANVDVIVGIIPKYSLYDVVFKDKKIEDIIIEGPRGIKIIPGGSGVESLSNLNDNQRQKLIHKFSGMKDIDILIVDTGAGISKNVLGFMALSDEIIVVTTPEPTSITDAYSLMKISLKYMPKSKLNVVINRASDENEANITYQKIGGAVKNFLKHDLNYLGYIDDDEKVRKAVMEQKPFKISYPDTMASKCINNIASSISGIPISNKKNTSVKDFFNRITYIFSKFGQ